MTHFYSSASVFRTATVFLNPFTSPMCPAVSNPVFVQAVSVSGFFLPALKAIVRTEIALQIGKKKSI